jgi:hypothetical protein
MPYPNTDGNLAALNAYQARVDHEERYTEALQQIMEQYDVGWTDARKIYEDERDEAAVARYEAYRYLGD